GRGGAGRDRGRRSAVRPLPSVPQRAGDGSLARGPRGGPRAPALTGAPAGVVRSRRPRSSGRPHEPAREGPHARIVGSTRARGARRRGGELCAVLTRV